MKFKCVVFYVNGLFILGISGLNSFDVNRIIFADSDNHNISKVRITSGLQAKLSPIHQQQILNDVQQHQLRHDASQKNHIITVPNQSEDTTVGSSIYPSFVKYRVDQNSNRSKKPVISNVNYYNQSNSNHPTTPPQLNSSTVNHSPSNLGSSLFRKFTPEESEIFLKAIAAHQVKFIEPKNSQKTTINPIKDNINNDKYSKVLLSSSEDQHQTNQHKTNLDLIENNDDTVDDIQTNESELINIQRELSKSKNIITPDKLILNKLNQKTIPTLNNKKLEYIEKSIDQNQSDKKVTFVILEEQFDGTFHIQGVKSSSDKKDSNDVKSIIDKIKKGEIDFVQPKESSISMNHSILTMIKPLTNKTTTVNLNTLTKSQDNEFIENSKSSFVSSTTPNYQYDNYVTSASTASPNYYKNLESIKSTTVKAITPSYIFLPKNYSPSSIKLDSTTENVSKINTAIINDADNLDFNDIKNKNSKTNYLSNQYSSNSMENLLKANGFFSMAKYLLQSGLNTVLNETGPYTVFIPSDRAFDKLLIHLGGAEKAERKFKENPRLLSGLLLHHAIPGAFDTDSLQDEMTGVSLAGTQLRVNVYNKDDNDRDSTNKITTINGAKIVSTKQNIQLPQGVAHEMDRVMFPLPIGDLMQTLAADREQRFGQFLKMLHASGLDRILTGTRTYTIFAPIDKYFESNAGHNKTSFRSKNLKEIISRHILPTTLYTAGISHYREMNTILPRFTLRIWKDDGQITVNDAVVVNRNIPATNGVIHAIDSIL
ncbi:hypothetical protein HCN44_006116 [Aphidius gifuensis]|uniref:FAS1 domain-containing protein n=1 Tax=Aphidius gifuensis TaxID=684658 RepID=A0A834Y1D5_APHGI|nr:protein PFF0380w [Aphidius gifuensis]KAF7997545.1 hypothetical protein HCN44_006116 [Aphidius gifuensis]